MSMALKTVLFHQRKDLFHLALIVDVFRKDILIKRITCRTVDEQQFAVAKGARTLTQEFPTEFVPFWITHFQLLTGPEDRSFGGSVETFGVKQGTLIVISQQ